MVSVNDGTGTLMPLASNCCRLTLFSGEWRTDEGCKSVDALGEGFIANVKCG